MKCSRSLVAALALLVLSGCQNDNDPGPGDVTVGEARALDDAAKMLESRPRSPAEAVAAQQDAERRTDAHAQSSQPPSQ